jgi:serine/threonine-protein kinase
MVRELWRLEDKTIIQFGAPGSVRRGVRLNGIYEIENLLAQGGMGEVYKGFNIQTRDPVAIKMVLPELASNADAFALFRREASTLHNLQHEAIVRYYVFSVDPELQRAYLAMEFVDGPSLTKRLAQGKLTLAEATILRKRIGGALEAAHRVGVIHRDISPDNIILPDGDLRRAKIIDFGIARSSVANEGTLIGGGFAGKYNYVSPEQLGLAGEVTAKSDIYSFGLVLAEALRGRPLDMSGTQVEIIEKRRAIPDLSDIDPSVRPLLQRMLQPLPADRPASMAEVAAWGEGQTAEAERADRARRGRKPGGERAQGGSAAGRIAAALGALIVLASVGGTLYVFRDALPWSGGASAPAGPTPSPSASANPPPAQETAAPSKLPPLPERPPGAAPPAQQTAAGAKPPPLPEPSPGPAAPATVAAPAAGSTVATAEPGPPPTPHVPSADEIVHSLDQMKQQKAAAPQPSPSAGAAAPVSGPAANSSQPQVATIAPSAPVAPAPRPSATAPPRAPQAALALVDASVGKDYVANLPPFSAPGGGKDVVLRAEPNPPDGLTFADLGSGFGQISGKPDKPGRYSFEIVAHNAAGDARMTMRIAIAPPPASNAAAGAAPAVMAPSQPAPSSTPASSPNAVVASLTPADKASSFLRDFDGGSCFLARMLGSGANSPAIQGIGSDKATFERFYVDFIKNTGVEPALNVRLIGAAECPALDLIRDRGADRASAPKIELASYDVGAGKPLAGTVVNLAGRHLDLLLVSSDGQLYRIETRVQPDGQSATFSIPITPDAAAVDALQLLLAIASSRPAPSLEGFRGGATAQVLPQLRGQLADASATLDVEFFKLVK